MLYKNAPQLLTHSQSADAAVRAENCNPKKTCVTKRPAHLTRPFKKWRDEVRAAINTPEIDRQVTQIYQDLLRHSNPIPAYHTLSTLLASTPKLFRAFKRLVPDESLEKWTAAERNEYEQALKKDLGGRRD